MFPPTLQNNLLDIVNAADGKTCMRDILGPLGLGTNFTEVNTIRLRLTSTAYPYLKAVSSNCT